MGLVQTFGLNDVVTVDNTCTQTTLFKHATTDTASLVCDVTSSGSGHAIDFKVNGTTQCYYGHALGFPGFVQPNTTGFFFFGVANFLDYIFINPLSGITTLASAITATNAITCTSLTSSVLTAGRVPFAGTGGLLQDDADMTFATDTLTVTNLAVTTAATGGSGNFHYPASFAYLYDDFSGNSTSAGDYSWSNQTSGTGAAVTNVAGESNHPGIRRFTTGTTATGYAGLNNRATFIAPGGGDVCRMILRLSANTGIILRCAIMDATTGADVTDGYYFEFDPATSANWRFCTAAGGTRTKTSSSTAVAASTWYRLRVQVSSDNASVEFFVDDVSLGTISTNIPTSSNTTGIALIVQNDGTSTTSVNCDVDLIYWYNKNISR